MLAVFKNSQAPLSTQKNTCLCYKPPSISSYAKPWPRLCQSNLTCRSCTTSVHIKHKIHLSALNHYFETYSFFESTTRQTMQDHETLTTIGDGTESLAWQILKRVVFPKARNEHYVQVTKYTMHHQYDTLNGRALDTNLESGVLAVTSSPERLFDGEIERSGWPPLLQYTQILRMIVTTEYYFHQIIYAVECFIYLLSVTLTIDIYKNARTRGKHSVFVHKICNG